MVANGWRHFVLVIISVLLLLKLSWIHHIHGAKSGDADPSKKYVNLLFGDVNNDYTLQPESTTVQYSLISWNCEDVEEVGTGSCRAARWAYYIVYACAVDLVIMTAMHASFLSSRAAKMLACAVSATASILIVVIMAIAGRAYDDMTNVEIEPDAFIYGTVMVLLFGAHTFLYVTASDDGSNASLKMNLFDQ